MSNIHVKQTRSSLGGDVLQLVVAFQRGSTLDIARQAELELQRL